GAGRCLRQGPPSVAAAGPWAGTEPRRQRRPVVKDRPRGPHVVVQASAGTGKTYRIEELVLELLTTRGVLLEQILVVTYTEKATGDLKERLRSRIEKELRRTDQHRSALQQALDDFDQAP